MSVHFFDEIGNGSGGQGNYILLSEKGQASGVATLDVNSKLTSSQLPDLSITNTYVVASESEMLALTVQLGDVAIRTDISKSFILKTEPANILANWSELLAPPNAVLSVEGKTGNVSLSDVYQPLNNELTAISGLSDASGLVRKTGDGTYSIDANNYFNTAGTGLTSTGNTLNAVGTSGRIVANADSIDLATTGTAGTYTKITTDAYGRAINGTTLADTDIPALPASKIINTAVTLSDTQTITGPKTFSNGFVSGNLTVGGTSQQAKLVVNRLGGNFTHPSLDANTAVVITAGGGLAASGAAMSLVGGNTSTVGLWFGDTDDTVIGGVQYFHSNDTLSFRIGGINRVNINSTTCSIPISTASTSTTTGAIVTPGGVGCGDLFAQSLNGQLVLAKYTTATRPVASAGTLGQVWLNTDTGKIEYVATSSTIQVITSA